LLFGNPGVGKSTFINAYLKACGIEEDSSKYCEAGVGAATGVTTVSKYIDLEHCVLIDTPGLADIKTRKKAAEQIAEGLERGGNFKIVFMCLLSAGRVRPEDVTTVNCVMDTLSKQKNVEYTLLVNKISTRVIRKLQANPEAFAFFIELLHQPPALVCFSLFNADLMDADNVHLDIEDQELIFHSEDIDDWHKSTPVNFRDGFEKFPVMHVDPSNILAMDTSTFDQLIEFFEEKIAEINKQNAEQLEMMKKEAEKNRIETARKVKENEEKVKQVQTAAANREKALNEKVMNATIKEKVLSEQLKAKPKEVIKEVIKTEKRCVVC